MTPMTPEQFCQKQARDLRRVIAQIEQMVRDAGHWNRLHEDESPIDFESERVSLAKLYACVRLAETGDTIKLGEALKDLRIHMEKAVEDGDLQLAGKYL